LKIEKLIIIKIENEKIEKIEIKKIEKIEIKIIIPEIDEFSMMIWILKKR
jgi:hypothetical protein